MPATIETSVSPLSFIIRAIRPGDAEESARDRDRDRGSSEEDAPRGLFGLNVSFGNVYSRERILC